MVSLSLVPCIALQVRKVNHNFWATLFPHFFFFFPHSNNISLYSRPIPVLAIMFVQTSNLVVSDLVVAYDAPHSPTQQSKRNHTTIDNLTNTKHTISSATTTTNNHHITNNNNNHITTINHHTHTPSKSISLSWLYCFYQMFRTIAACLLTTFGQ